METISLELTSNLRRETLDGRQYLVADASIIVPGVLNGSQGALYYPVDEVSKNPGIWNGVPVTVNHPFDELGNNVSARSPKIEKKFRIGTVYNDRFENGKRRAEVWLDEELTKNKSADIYKLASAGLPIELSTGLFTDNEPVKNGKSPDGREYQFIARNYRPDHLAILPNQTGACSLKDGCGLNVNELQVDNCGGEGGTPGPCASGGDKKPGGGKTYLGSLSKAKAEAFVAANPGTSHTEEKNAYGNVIGHKVHSEHSPDTKEYFLHQKALLASKGGDVTKSLAGDYKHGLVKKSSTTNTEVTSVTNQKRTLLSQLASLLGFKVNPVANAKKVCDNDDDGDGGGDMTDNAWSDEARQAAIEARKAGTASKSANDLSKHPTTTKESAIADSTSKHAEVAGHTGGHIDASLSHAQAAAAHMHANDTFRKSGETEKADAHLKAFAAHSKASKAHEAVTRKAFGGPSITKNADSSDEPDADDMTDNCGGEGGTPGPCKTNAPGSGPHPSNGKPKSEIASALSTEIRQKYGQKNLDTRGHTQAAEAHENAVGIHQEAAKEQSKLGNYQKATTHTIAAKNHAFSAKKHRAWEKSGKTGSIASGRPIGNNSSNGDDMDRNKLVLWLTTNCDCHKGKEKVLANQDNYSDEELLKLKTNAETAMKNATLVANAKLASNAEVPVEEEEEEDEEEDMPFKGKKKAPMVNSLAQFEASMPPAAKAIWNSAKEVEQSERLRLTSIITANISDVARKQVLTNKLMDREKTTLDDLRDLASAIPQRQVRNQQGVIPNYFGSQPGAQTQTNNISSDDVLDLPTINWADLAKSGDVRTRV